MSSVELILWVSLGVLAGVAVGWVLAVTWVPWGWAGGDELSAEAEGRIAEVVRRELGASKLRGWRADAAAKDALLASAQECARAEARAVLREAWRAEAADAAAGDFSERGQREPKETGGVA